MMCGAGRGGGGMPPIRPVQDVLDAPKVRPWCERRWLARCPL